MIRKLRTLFWLGILMLVVPFVGIPGTWKTAGAVAVGIAMVSLAVGMRGEYSRMQKTLKQYEQ